MGVVTTILIFVPIMLLVVLGYERKSKTEKFICETLEFLRNREQICEAGPRINPSRIELNKLEFSAELRVHFRLSEKCLDPLPALVGLQYKNPNTISATWQPKPGYATFPSYFFVFSSRRSLNQNLQDLKDFLADFGAFQAHETFKKGG